MVSKWKGAIRKGHTSFLFFNFWYLKFLPIDSALSSASGNLTYLFQKCRCGTKKKQANLKIHVKMFLKCLLWSIITKLENAGTKLFYRTLIRNRLDESFQILVLILWLVTLPCFLEKIAHVVIAFSPEREEEIKHWFWHIWIAQ